MQNLWGREREKRERGDEREEREKKLKNLGVELSFSHAFNISNMYAISEIRLR